MAKRKTSQEELDFMAWCEEAQAHGIIKAWAPQPQSFELIPEAKYSKTVQMKTKVKQVERTLFQDHKYTPDFVVYARFRIGGVLFPRSHEAGIAAVYFVDTKGGHTLQRGQVQMFQCNRKLMWQRHGIYIEKVVPAEFFKRTFIPESLRWCKGRKVATMRILATECRTVAEFVAGVAE